MVAPQATNLSTLDEDSRIVPPTNAPSRRIDVRHRESWAHLLYAWAGLWDAG